jgi:hypothetical protein
MDMRSKDLIITLKQLSRELEYGLHREPVLERIEKILQEHLATNPHATTLWFRLAITEYTIPWQDYEKAIWCINQVLKYDSKNGLTWLMLAYIQYVSFGLPPKTFETLQAFSVKNRGMQSLLFYAQSWFYQEQQDINNYEDTLLQSIKYCDKFVWNHLHLGMLYHNSGNIDQRNNHLICGLSNIKVMGFVNTLHTDITSIERFFNIYLKGIYFSQPNFERYIAHLMNE